MTMDFNRAVSVICIFVGQEKQRPATSQTTELKKTQELALGLVLPGSDNWYLNEGY